MSHCWKSHALALNLIILVDEFWRPLWLSLIGNHKREIGESVNQVTNDIMSKTVNRQAAAILAAVLGFRFFDEKYPYI